jgi:RNA polymerase sigma-70 factor (ECF subfamily)
MNSIININTDVIHRAQKGDAEMISVLYDCYHESIFRYLYYRTGDRHTAEDLTSEVFERMLRFLGSFKPPANAFGAWLFQIARNCSTDHYRKMRGKENLELVEETIPARDVLASGMDGNIEKALTSDMLRKALEQLNEDQREVVIMRFISGMPIGEVAKTIGKSEDAVKGLQRRALMSLRDVLNGWEVLYE